MGELQTCPICNGIAPTEPSAVGDATCCADCRQVLSWCRENYDRLAFDDPAAITFNKTLFDPADSLDIAEIVMEVEQHFGVTIPDEEWERFQSIADVVGCVVRLRNR